MKTSDKLIQRLGKTVRSTLLLLLPAVQSFAENVIDSDLSNSAGTNKNWHNGFWFLGVVTLLAVVFYSGMARHYKKVRRDILFKNREITGP